METAGNLNRANSPINPGAAATCRECGATFTPAPDGNPRYCEACLPVVAERLRRRGTPIPVYRYPEEVFGADDVNVWAVKAAAARAGRTWEAAHRGDEQAAKHRAAGANLAEVLQGTDTARLRFWAGCTMIDGRWCGASGTGAYWAVASRLVNEAAAAELRRRGDAWRAAGLGPFSTIEAIEAAGLDEADRGARPATGEIPPAREAA